MFYDEPVKHPWVWKKKFIIIPKRCMYSDEIIWPGVAYKGVRYITSVFDEEKEVVWVKRFYWENFIRFNKNAVRQ